MARPPLPNDPVRNPPSADSLRLGTTVAVIAHVGLIAALASGVAWKREEIATVTAELWSAVPQQAAPAAPPPPPAPVPQVQAEPVVPPVPAPVLKPPPPPPPPAPAPKVVEPPPPAPRDADIAREKADKRRREAEEAEEEKRLAKLEQAKRDKAEKAEKAEKAAKDKDREKEREKEREKAEQKEAEKQAALKKEAERKAAATEKAKEAAQQEKTAKAREDNLKRLQKQLGEGGSEDNAPPSPSRATAGTGSGGGTAAQSSGPSAGYAGRLRAYLKPKLVYTGRNIGSTPAVVRLRVAPDGTILSRELIKSSGQADWDQAVLDAIDRAGIVPRDTDSRVPPVIDIPWTASER